MKRLLLFAVMIFSSQFITAQDYAIAQLENSPRHHEWRKLKSNGRALHCFVTYPEKSENATTIVVIHENRGLNDWARSMADQLAEAGYIAIAPDLLSGASDVYEKTSDYPNSDEARKAIYGLDSDAVTKDLNVVFDFAKSIDGGNGEVAVMGFCWGGSQTFRYATNNKNILAAMVFYGTAPKEAKVFSKINAPVYGFYGGADQRVNATIEMTKQYMKENKKKYTYEIYDGAGHAFMRRGDDPNGDEPNVNARNKAWERIKDILN